MSADICIIIPMKPAALAKSRLRHALSPSRRQRLASAMFRRTLKVCRSVLDSSSILVVSADVALLRALASQGHAVLRDPPNATLNEALDAARREAEHRGFRRVLILPADLPCLSRASLESLLQKRGPVLVPDRAGTGTNALLLDPIDAGFPSFGENSFERHLALFGPRLSLIRDPALALDLDTPSDVSLWLNRPVSRIKRLPTRPSLFGCESDLLL
jgi:2-phospho-L-lactate/phosphoenolpyruvate guanylyltransferase